MVAYILVPLLKRVMFGKRTAAYGKFTPKYREQPPIKGNDLVT